MTAREVAYVCTPRLPNGEPVDRLIEACHKTPRKKLAPAKSGHSRSGAGAIALQDWEGLAVLGGRLAQQPGYHAPIGWQPSRGEQRELRQPIHRRFAVLLDDLTPDEA
jgi:hypothetical protein